MTVESRDGVQSHKSSALSLLLGKLAQEKTCHVGQITCICSPSQELSPRRETGRGLFDSDGDPHSRAHSPSQRIAARRVPRVAVRTSYLAPAFARPCSHPPITTNHHEGASMTAYLISLSLAGLIAIAVWEALS
jgi:hypothetical protein